MSRHADAAARRIGLVLCLLVSLAPRRVSAQEREDTAEFAARRARLLAERYGLPVQPMESFFAFLSFAAWRPAVRKLYVQLSPPDDLLHSRGEARAASAIAMDHPVLGHTPEVGQAIERLHAAVPHLVLADVSPKLDELRWVKSAYESQRLRQAGRIGAAAVAEAIKGTHPGMYEYEIAAAAQGGGISAILSASRCTT